MKFIEKILSFAIVGLFLYGCTNVEFQSEYDNQVDFNKYRTYAICTDDLDVVDLDHALFDNSENRMLIAASITESLNDIGYVEDSGSPDLEAGFKIILRDQIAEVKSCGNEQENDYWTGCTIDIHEYTEGTLVLRLTDLNEKQVIWEGSAKGVLITDQNKLHNVIDRTIEQLFLTFPIQELESDI